MLKNVLAISVWFLAAVTFTLSLGIHKGYALPIALIFICTSSLLFIPNIWAGITKEDKWMFYSFILFSISMFAFSFFDEGGARGIDKPSRFIFASLVLLLLLNLKNYKEFLWYGVVSGSFFAFILSLYERFLLGYERAHGGEHPIMFGNMGMLLGMMSFSSAAYFYDKRQKSWMFIAIFSGFCGIGASFLSGSRGGWVALPLILFFLLWHSRSLVSNKTRMIMILILTFCLTLVFVIPQTNVKNRIEGTLANLSLYSSGIDKDTSIGLRFEMWKSAYFSFSLSPLFGVGSDGSMEQKKVWVEKKLVHPKVVNYSHAHNEYLDTLEKRGIVGLFFLLVLYLVPLKLFLKKIYQYEHDWSVKSYAITGALIPMCYIDFGLSQVMFSHNTGVMLYAFPIVYFWAALRWSEREFN